MCVCVCGGGVDGVWVCVVFRVVTVDVCVVFKVVTVDVRCVQYGDCWCVCVCVCVCGVCVVCVCVFRMVTL